MFGHGGVMMMETANPMNFREKVGNGQSQFFSHLKGVFPGVNALQIAMVDDDGGRLICAK